MPHKCLEKAETLILRVKSCVKYFQSHYHLLMPDGERRELASLRNHFCANLMTPFVKFGPNSIRFDAKDNIEIKVAFSGSL